MPVREFREPDTETVAQWMVALLEDIRAETSDPYFRWNTLDAAAFRSELARAASDPTRQIFIAEDRGLAVGFLDAAIVRCFLPFSVVEKVGHIFAAYVEPSYRGRGLVEELEAAAAAFFSTQELQFVELHVLSRNSIAARTWSRLGYQTFREQMRRRL
jgi:ribosomal protein S18 acetylase RimI-like enzyme